MKLLSYRLRNTFYAIKSVDTNNDTNKSFSRICSYPGE